MSALETRRFKFIVSVVGAVGLLTGCGSTSTEVTGDRQGNGCHTPVPPHSSYQVGTQCFYVRDAGDYTIHYSMSHCDGVTFVAIAASEGIAVPSEVTVTAGSAVAGSVTVNLAGGSWGIYAQPSSPPSCHWSMVIDGAVRVPTSG